MTKSLTLTDCKKMWFGFKMQEGKSLKNNLDHFNKIILGLENRVVKVNDEGKAVTLS